MSCAWRVSGTIFIRYDQYRQIGKSINLKVFENNKTKGPKQDTSNQNQLRSPMCEEGKP